MLIEVLVCIGWFCVAVMTDALSVAWQQAREDRKAARTAHIAVALELVTWAPLVLVYATGYWSVIVASLAGSWVGSYFAVRHLKKKLPGTELPIARTL